jgi:hypothetical protein
MFKKIGEWFAKRKADKAAKNAKTVYVMGHILLILSNNLKSMKSITDQQKNDLYKLYVKTLWTSMTDDNRVLFTQALGEVDDALDKVIKGVPSNQVQIQRQLQEIFKAQQK